MKKRIALIVIAVLGLALALVRTDLNLLPGKLDGGRVAGKKIETAEGKLTVLFFDVGQGDAIFIETPKHKQILIDGGPDETVMTKLSAVMDYGDKFIDAVVLTHPHADHVTGLNQVLKNYQVGEVWLTGVTHTAATYLEFLDLVRGNNIPARVIYSCGNQNESGISPPSTDLDNSSIDTGDRPKGENYELWNDYSGCLDSVEVEDGIRFRVLYPLENLSGRTAENLNNSSIVLKLTDGNNSFLLMGDAEEPVEKELLETFDTAVLRADILKAGHHGANNASSEDFLQAVKPSTAAISVGTENDYGHPSLRVLRRMERMGIKVSRTDEEGDVVFSL